MYYETLEALLQKYDRTPKQYAFCAENKEEYASWKERTRARLAEITGLSECEPAPLAPSLRASCQKNGFVRESWVITTEPGIRMPFYLLRPQKTNGAALLFLHGHGGGKEMLAGDQVLSGEKGLNGDQVLSQGKEHKLSFAEEMVRDGFLVICPDERGSGERRERFEQGEDEVRIHANSHRELQQAAMGFGQSMVGLGLWDLMRLLDFVETLPEVGAGRIGCAGFSGGGQMTLWLAAMDDRIRAAMTGGYFYGMKDALVEMCNNCSCNYVPFLWKTLDMGDLGALVAPRPLFIENGAADPLSGRRGLENVYEQLEITKKAYRLYGAEEKLLHSTHAGGHVWYGVGVKEFFQTNL